VDRAGAHLIDLVVRGERGTRVIEVFIDSEAGITSDACTAVSRSVGEALEASREIDGAYRLVVSSPGIDRPLQFPWQYKKHIGRRMEVRLRPAGGPEQIAGTLVGVDEDGITVRTGKQGEEVRTPFAMIEEARVKTPW
jgi:ribosome maturation factor RimP